jgi:hypothetical protein
MCLSDQIRNFLKEKQESLYSDSRIRDILLQQVHCTCSDIEVTKTEIKEDIQFRDKPRISRIFVGFQIEAYVGHFV